jgi:hypothetical protein
MTNTQCTHVGDEHPERKSENIMRHPRRDWLLLAHRTKSGFKSASTNW